MTLRKVWTHIFSPTHSYGQIVRYTSLFSFSKLTSLGEKKKSKFKPA